MTKGSKQRDESPVKKEQSKEPSGSKRIKKNGKWQTLCSYYGRGFHPESTYMRRKIDDMSLLMNKHNITVPSSARKGDHRKETEEYDET